MSLNINEVGVVTINATKDGQPGSFEKINSASLSIPEAGVITIAADGLSIEGIKWGSKVFDDITLTVDLDNISGEGGSLVRTSAPFSLVDPNANVLSNDATVNVS